MGNIVAIGGRKLSGKSELSKYLVNEHGYRKISFAEGLKTLCSQLFNLDLQFFIDQNLKEQPFEQPLQWNVLKCKELAFLIDQDNVNNTFVANTYLGDALFKTPRDTLQYIGTNVLKRHDPLFHVKNTIATTQADQNYVLDDLRFIEEKYYLEKLKTHSFFGCYLIKPDNWQVSNHRSEISLNWSMFKNHIVNNSTIPDLIDNFKKMFEHNQTIEHSVNNAFLLDDYLSRKYSSFIFNDCQWKIVNNNGKTEMHIYHKEQFYDVNKSKIKELCDYINSEMVYNNSLPTILNDKTVIITCPFVIENLKYWLPNV